MATNRTNNLKKTLLKALAASSGTVSDACRKAGCARKTYYEYLKADPDFALEVHDIREAKKDLADSELLKLIKAGNLGAIIWFQKNQCRDRGYTDSNHVIHEGVQVREKYLESIKKVDTAIISKVSSRRKQA